jgi:hypothetical protein
MPTWQETLIIASGLVKELRGDVVQANPAIVNLPVWPDTHSSGLRASTVILYAANEVHVQALSHSSSPEVSTGGPASAKLIATQPYVFPLHPTVNTLQFLDAQSETSQVDVLWVIR